MLCFAVLYHTRLRYCTRVCCTVPYSLSARALLLRSLPRASSSTSLPRCPRTRMPRSQRREVALHCATVCPSKALKSCALQHAFARACFLEEGWTANLEVPAETARKEFTSRTHKQTRTNRKGQNRDDCSLKPDKCPKHPIGVQQETSRRNPSNRKRLPDAQMQHDANPTRRCVFPQAEAMDLYKPRKTPEPKL